MGIPFAAVAVRLTLVCSKTVGTAAEVSQFGSWKVYIAAVFRIPGMCDAMIVILNS